MYEDLVKRLHRMLDWELMDYDANFKFADETIAEAADAIEELSMKLHGDEAAIAGMKREIERMVVAGKPRWIPVTEEPPLKVGDDGYNGYLVYANGYYEVADYEPKPTHWARRLPEPQKEEE